MSSSFKKAGKGKLLNIPGTRSSLHNNQLLISSGVQSLDALLGGGVIVGSVTLIEEDACGVYSRMLMKYNLAEAVMSRQQLFLAAADEIPNNLLQDLPGAISDEPNQEAANHSAVDEDNMDIAWRYKNLPKVQSSPVATKFGHYYDLTTKMSTSLLDSTSTTVADVSDEPPVCHCGKLEMNSKYNKVLKAVAETLERGKYMTSVQNQDRGILRICLSSLGSPQWAEDGADGGGGERSDPSLCRFLFALRSLLRSSFAACLITMPTHLYKDSALVSRVRHLCDTVLRLESFAGSAKEKNPAYREYHGLFHIVKLPRLNSLTCHMPDTLDLAFKLRRKKFTIERLHLPPDLSETASRGDQEDPLKAAAATQRHTVSLGCGTGHSKLDF